MEVNGERYPAICHTGRRSVGLVCTMSLLVFAFFVLSMIVGVGEIRANPYDVAAGKMMSVRVSKGEGGNTIENVSVEAGLVNPLRQVAKELTAVETARHPRLEILNSEGTVIYTKEFDYPELITVPMPEPGQPPDDLPAIIPVSNPEITLIVPYFPDADSIRIYDPLQEKPSAAIPVENAQFETADGVPVPPLSAPWTPGAFNVLIMASGYKAAEMKNFRSRAETVRDKLLSTEPFKANASKIKVNFYNNTKDLGCHSGVAGIERLLSCDQDKVIRAAAKSGKYYDEIIVVHNTSKYAGGGSRERNDSYKTNSYNSYCVVYDGPYTPVMTIHEFGHSFGNLCDEYSYGVELFIYSNCVNCRPSCSDYSQHTSACTLSCDAEPAYSRPDDSVMLTLDVDSYNGATIKANYAPDGLDKRLHFFIDRPPCQYTIAPKESSFLSKGGQVTVNVSANGQGCNAPQVISNAPWITAGIFSFVDNRGKIKVTVLPNDGISQRNGTVTIADKTFTVTQKGVVCTLGFLVPATRNFLSSGGTEVFPVAAASTCTWTAEVDPANASWLKISSGGTGTGAGRVVYSVSANATGKRRVGTISVRLTASPEKKKTFTVIQTR
jgi:hypothetical protein